MWRLATVLGSTSWAPLLTDAGSPLFATRIPDCHECHVQLGEVYARQKQFDQAEAAFKKAIELKADSAAAYDGLAAIYNTQGKMDLASEASTKAVELHAASGGGDATSAYNAGCVTVAVPSIKPVPEDVTHLQVLEEGGRVAVPRPVRDGGRIEVANAGREGLHRRCVHSEPGDFAL